MLCSEKIKSALDDRVISLLDQIELLPQVDSTNEHLKRHQASPRKNMVCIAEQQRAGKGRRGNQWVSPAGSNIYLSVRWHFATIPQDLSCLSLACAIACVDALQSLAFAGIEIKWPNDLYFNQRKLGGILIERQNNLANVIIGIGINCNMSSEFDRLISQNWINLFAVGQAVSRNLIISTILNYLLPLLADYPATGFVKLRGRWDELDMLKQQNVIISGADNISGVVCGLDSDCALLIKTLNGQQKIHAGDVSLRLE